MELNVKLFTGLICNNPHLACHGQSKFLLSIPEGTTIRILRNMLGINPDLPLLTLVNNCTVIEERELKDHDRIGILLSEVDNGMHTSCTAGMCTNKKGGVKVWHWQIRRSVSSFQPLPWARA